MGSKLRDRQTGELVWVDVPALLSNIMRLREKLDWMFTALAYPNPDIQPAGILDQVIFMPPLFKQEQYGRMLAALEKMGYDIDPEQLSSSRPAAYTFSYDWRQDNRISARQLGEAIDLWRRRHPGAKAWIIAHSNGGIVSRWYIEKEGGKDHVGRLFLMGSPWDGAPKALETMMTGFEVTLLRLFNLLDAQQRSREIIQSFPSFYQLIPVCNPFLRNLSNEVVDPFSDFGWIEGDAHKQMALDGKRFNQELGTTLSVETLCFFGARQPTTNAGLVRYAAGDRWSGVEWSANEAGDGTVPERSAVHPNALEKLPYAVGHGDIYVNPAVLEKLEWELVRKYRTVSGTLAEAVTERLKIGFEPGKDFYEPGEEIRIWASIHDKETGVPVSGGQVDVSVILQQELVASTPFSSSEPLATLRMRESEEIPGRYEAAFAAPDSQGYYALNALVQAPGEPAVTLEELVLVEREPNPAWLEGLHSAAIDHAEPPDDEPLAEDRERSADLVGEEDLSLEIGTLVDSDEATTPADTAVPEPPAATDVQPPLTEAQERYLNCQIEDHEVLEPLQTGEIYTLAFSVDLIAQAAAVVFDGERVFTEEEEVVKLAVHINTKDFFVHTTGSQTLVVPRKGKSKNKARFDIEPKRPGEGEVTVVFFKNNNFIQGMTVRLNVGDPAKGAITGVEKVGRSPEGAFAVQPRDVSLFIKNTGAGFDITMVGVVAAEATLPLTLPQLDQMASRVRQALKDIVYMGKGSAGIQVYPKGTPMPADVDLVYQSHITIPADVNAEALKRLSRAGYLLYQDIFYGPSASAEANLLGDKLCELASKETLKIQIVSQEFLLPWGVLYLAPEYDPANINPSCFLGLKHIIEHIPIQQHMSSMQGTIPSRPLLSVGVNFNTDIDSQLSMSVVRDQQAFWKGIQQSGLVQVSERTSGDEVYQSLTGAAPVDQILYFYCHAVSYQLNDPAGPGSSYLKLSNQQRVSLDELRLRASVKKPLSGSPLIFINACESAELSPLFYGGFMPYFTSRGARGMIGTECETPARFAAGWANEFFQEFLAGDNTLGEVILKLRQKYYYQDNNLMGLLYALYCDGDTRIDPGIQL